MIVASYVRLHHVSWNPAWYTDEGTHIEIAKNLMEGNNQYLGITDSYLIAARLPLFEHLLALWFRFTGIGMFQLRLLTVFMALITTAVLYRLVLIVTQNVNLTVGAVSLFTIYPQAVIYSRFGFSYNLLGLLIVAALWFLFRYFRHRDWQSVLVASLLIGLGTITDFIALSFIPVILFISFMKCRQHLILSLATLALPFAVYTTIEMLAHPNIFVHDLSYTLSRAGGISISQQLDNIMINIRVLATESRWVPIGFTGLFFVNSRTHRWILVAVVVLPILISGRTVALYNLSAYYMIPFLPFFCVGIVALLYYVVSRLPLNYQVASKIFLLCIGMIMVPTYMQLIHSVNTSFTVGIEHFLIKESEAIQVRNFTIDYAKENDLIITSPTLAWMFNTHVTDFQIASLTENDSVHFPQSIYPSRFAYDICYTTAKFAIVDNLWRDWGAVHMPNVSDMLEAIRQWDLIFETESIQVYENPQA